VAVVEEKDAQKYVVPIRYAKVVRVYDGDTIFVVMVLPGSNVPHKFSVRLRGIDACRRVVAKTSPEMKGGSAEEKAAALRSRDALHSLLHGRIVELRQVAYDKYGRVLAEVHLVGEQVSASEWMLQRRLAVPYDGGKKKVWAGN
jgi:endonuclease YncB( thermonuclease family)